MEQKTNETTPVGKNHPLQKFRAGSITATIWENKRLVNGKTVGFYNVTLDRHYQDKDGKWQSSNSFRVQDLPKAELVLQKAFEYVMLSGIREESVPETYIQTEGEVATA